MFYIRVFQSNSESSASITESVAELKAKVVSIQKDLQSRIKVLELHKTTLENINQGKNSHLQNLET